MEMFTNGTLKDIKEQLMSWGASSVTAEILMSVFDSTDGEGVSWLEFEKVILRIIADKSFDNARP